MKNLVICIVMVMGLAACGKPFSVGDCLRFGKLPRDPWLNDCSDAIVMEVGMESYRTLAVACGCGKTVFESSIDFDLEYLYSHITCPSVLKNHKEPKK